MQRHKALRKRIGTASAVLFALALMVLYQNGALVPAEFVRSDYRPHSKHKEFDVAARFAQLTDSRCDLRLVDRRQFAFFKVEHFYRLHKIWHGLDRRPKMGACQLERRGAMSAEALMRCDLEQLARLAAVSRGRSVTLPTNSQVAYSWYEEATAVARQLQPLAYACSIKTVGVSVQSVQADKDCQLAKQIFLNLARQTLLAPDPFPDGLMIDGLSAKNSGHKALYVAGPVIGFAALYEVLSVQQKLFSSKEKREIRNWFLRQARVVLDGQATWQSWYRRSEAEATDKALSIEGNNHFSQQNLALAAIGGALHNRCLIEYASYSPKNLTHFKAQIGRSLMSQADSLPHAHDKLGHSRGPTFPVFQGEVIDRYRGQYHGSKHIGQALGYSSLTLGSLGTHAVLYRNLRSDFDLSDKELGEDPMVYRAPRLGKSVSILDSIEFYGRQLERNFLHQAPYGKFGGPRSSREDAPYYCSPELKMLGVHTCDESTEAQRASIDFHKNFFGQHYTILAPLILDGALRGRSPALRAVSSSVLFNCRSKRETTVGAELVLHAQGRRLDRVWPLHPLLKRWQSHTTCAR